MEIIVNDSCSEEEVQRWRRSLPNQGVAVESDKIGKAVVNCVSYVPSGRNWD